MRMGQSSSLASRNERPSSEFQIRRSSSTRKQLKPWILFGYWFDFICLMTKKRDKISTKSCRDFDLIVCLHVMETWEGGYLESMGDFSN